MSELSQINDKLTQIINWMNSVNANSKTTEELPAQELLILTSLIRVYNAGASQKITVQQIIDAARTNINGLAPWAPGTYSVQTGVIRNNKIYLLSEATSLPFTSVDFSLELEAGDWILPNIPTTVELAEGPNTIVFDLGDITDLVTDDDFVAYINTSGDVYDSTDESKTYFYRFILNGIDYLYTYNSAAGGFLEYGTGTGNTMLIDYLNLFYNTSIGATTESTPRAYLELRVIEKGIYDGVPNTGVGLEKGDFVAGRKDIDTYWDRAMYLGDDPEDRENCYEQLSGGGPSIIP